MKVTAAVVVLGVCCQSINAFIPVGLGQGVVPRRSALRAKGFGKEPEPEKPKEKTKGQLAVRLEGELAPDMGGRRIHVAALFGEGKEHGLTHREAEAGAKAYDTEVASGTPEYLIFAREKGTEDEYVPAGTMAVPRSQKLPAAVWEQEESLKRGAVKLWGNLKGKELEYGYTLKVYPDDPIRPLVVEEPTSDPIKQFFNSIMDPINAKKADK